MIGVLLTQAGLVILAACVLGGLARIVSGAAVGLGLLAGTVCVVAGWLWTAPLRQRGESRSALDRLVPAWQFDERHTIEIAGTPEAVFAAVEAVTAGEIRGLRTLTWLRRGGRPTAGASILAPPADRPILESALAGGFRLLVSDRPRELVVGMQVAGARVADPWNTQEPGAHASGRGHTIATLGFAITSLDETRCRLVTETRVHATTPASRRAFAPYWRVIYPGSALIRRLWLRAIRRRVEGTERLNG